MERKLYRDQQHKVIGGVCAGLAEYFNIDVSIIRVLFVASVVLKGSGVLLYCILMIVLPKKNYIFNDPNVDYKVPPDPLGYNPAGPLATKQRSNGAIIAGGILIIIGGIFLLDQLDFIPDFDYGELWPVILILVGLVFIFNRPKREPWKEDNWKNTNKKDDTTNDNPPTE